MYFSSMYDMQKKFLCCMQVTYVPMLAQFITSIMHVGFCYLFVTIWGLDVAGIGYANVASGFVNLIFTVVYSSYVP